MGRYLCLISVFILSLVVGVMVHGIARAQILPGSGNQAGAVYMKIDAPGISTLSEYLYENFADKLKTGTLKGVSCGANYKQYNECYEVIPTDISESKKCFRANQNQVGKFNRERPLGEQIIYYGAGDVPYKDGISYWLDIDVEIPEHGYVRIDGKGYLIECPQLSSPDPSLKNEIKHLKQLVGDSNGIENCLLAERTLRNTNTTYWYDRVRFLCFMRPSLADAKDLQKNYKAAVVEGSAETRQSLGNNNINSAQDETDAICHRNIRTNVVSAAHATNFYRLNSAEPEIPDGQAVLAFAVEEKDCEAKADTVQ